MIENYIKPSQGPTGCLDTITFATSSEFPDLAHIWEVADRWRGPISLALYCATEDFQNCQEALKYILNCGHKPHLGRLIEKYLSVHLFFEDSRIPRNVSIDQNSQ